MVLQALRGRHADVGHGRDRRRARRRRRRSRPRSGWAGRPRPTPRRGPSGCSSRRSPRDGRSCWPSRTPTGPSRRCSTSSTSSRADRWRRPSCCCASGAPSCSTARPAWARGDGPAARLRWTRRPAAACSAPGRRCPTAALERVVARARGNPLFLEQLAAHVRERTEDRLAPAGAARAARRPPRHARRDRAPASSRRARSKGRPSTSAACEALVPGTRTRRACRRALDALVAARARAPRLPVHRRSARVSLRARARPRRGLRGDAAGGAGRRARAAGRRGSRTSAPRCPRRAPASARSSSAPTAPRASCACPPRGSTRSRTRAARRLAEAAHEVHRRGDLPSEIAFLERALALLAPRRRARAELLPAMGVALFEAGSLERAERWRTRRWPSGIGPRAPARRGRARAHARLPAPRVGGPRRVARRRRGRRRGARGARRRRRRRAGALPDVRARLAAGRVGARACARRATALRFARRDPAARVELDAGVSVIAWALVVNRVPVSAARAECDELLRARGRASLRRARRARLRGGARRDGRRLRAGARRSSLGRATGCASSGCTRPRSGWRCSTPRSELLAGDPAAAEAALDDAERVAREIGDRWFLSTIRVDRAHVLLAQDRLARGRRGGRAHRRGPGAQRPRVARQAPRGARQARRPRGRRRAGARARPAPRSPWPTRPSMFLFRADAWRDLAEVAERVGEAEEARGRARDGARRSIAPRATSPPRASSRASAVARARPSRWTASARRAPSSRRGSRAPRPGRPPAPRRPPSPAPSGAPR